jgi:recombination protein RecA
MKIGVMFGNPETTTGGNALKFYASARLDIRRVSALKNGEDVVGSRTRVKVVKNKMAPPFKQVEFDIIFGEGISMEGDLIDLGLAQGVVDKSGSWLSFGGEKLGQGRDNTRLFLKEHPEIVDKIRKKIQEKVSAAAAAAGGAAPLAVGPGASADEDEEDEPGTKTNRPSGVRVHPKKGD